MLEAVIFDMDGVIVDSEPLHYAAESRIFALLGVEVPDAERHSFIGMAGAGMWKAVRESRGMEMTVEELREFDRKVRLEFFAGVERIDPVAGALELLAGLNRRGTKTALASSSSPELIELVLKRLGVRGLFDAVVSGDTVPRGKPAPDIYLRAAELLNARPANCIAIEDSRNGVMSAKGAGMRCVAYRNLNSPGQDLDAADMIIDDFRLLREEDLRALAGG